MTHRASGRWLITQGLKNAFSAPFAVRPNPSIQSLMASVVLHLQGLQLELGWIAAGPAPPSPPR